MNIRVRPNFYRALFPGQNQFTWVNQVKKYKRPIRLQVELVNITRNCFPNLLKFHDSMSIGLKKTLQK